MQKRKVGLITFFVLGITVTLAVMGYEHSTQRQKEHLLAVYAGPQNLEIISHPDRILAYKIMGDKTLAGPKPVPANLKHQLITSLSDPLTFETTWATSCIPMYGALFTFQKQSKTVKLRFCFNCGYMEVNHQENLTATFNTTEPYHVMKALYPDFDETKIEAQYYKQH